MNTDIETRDQIYTLVIRFYAKIRKDELLGPIFNTHINDWNHHMNKITDFWERNLLATGSFSGNPGRTHIQVDQHENNTLSASHFNRWLSLWYQTLDTMYKGPITEEAKEKATRIGSNFLRMIMLNRSQKLSGPGFFAPEFKQTARPESEADPSANSKPNTPPES